MYNCAQKIAKMNNIFLVEIIFLPQNKKNINKYQLLKNCGKGKLCHLSNRLNVEKVYENFAKKIKL